MPTKSYKCFFPMCQVLDMLKWNMLEALLTTLHTNDVRNNENFIMIEPSLGVR